MQNKLNVGCGNKSLDGYLNLDCVNLPEVDVIHDLNQYPYPFENRIFDFVYLDNVLEHLDCVVSVLEELHRISKHGANIEVIVPYFTAVTAHQDPTHKHSFTLKSFDYFTENFDYNFYTKARFKIIEKELYFSPKMKIFQWLFNKYKWLYEKQGLPYLIPASALRVTLEVLHE